MISILQNYTLKINLFWREFLVFCDKPYFRNKELVDFGHKDLRFFKKVLQNEQFHIFLYIFFEKVRDQTESSRIETIRK